MTGGNDTKVLVSLALSGVGMAINGVVMTWLMARRERRSSIWGAIASLINGVTHFLRFVDRTWIGDHPQVLNIMYLDYVLVCPLIMYDFAINLRVNHPKANAVMTALLMIIATLAYPSKKPMVWFGVGAPVLTLQIIYFAIIFYRRPLNNQVALGSLVLTWIVFPLVFVVAHYNDWSNADVTMANAIMDLFAKTGVAIAIYFAVPPHSKIHLGGRGLEVEPVLKKNKSFQGKGRGYIKPKKIVPFESSIKESPEELQDEQTNHLPPDTILSVSDSELPEQRSSSSRSGRHDRHRSRRGRGWRDGAVAITFETNDDALSTRADTHRTDESYAPRAISRRISLVLGE